MDEVKQVIPCVVENHTNSREWDDARSEFKGHLNEGAMLVKIFEGVECDVFILLWLIHVFLILSILV